ncbi:MAG: helix-turn-helix transcriptional regulator [Clostridia bacterium]|nr:helix-turn-helix transcriptional regulator [Clostridia bacterium]
MNKIRELREDRDLRQSDVAEATGIDQRTLSNYETGKTNPDSYAIIKLCDFFNVSADYLIGRSDDKSLAIQKIEKKISEIQAGLNDIAEHLKKL